MMVRCTSLVPPAMPQEHRRDEFILAPTYSADNGPVKRTTITPDP
jgi:hypothetical protein